MHVLVFHHCDKIPEKNNLKGGKSYFGSPWSFGSCFWASGETVPHGGKVCQRKPAHLMVAKKQRERKGQNKI
jgi:hypothetical protein